MMPANDAKNIWKIGYVSGTFDLFHVGHLNLLRNAREHCEHLIVGILSDDAVVHAKKRQPIITLRDRLSIVSAIRYVDEIDVTTKALLNKLAAWEKYHFNAMFSGDDHNFEAWTKERDELKALGAELVFFPHTKGISTSYLREGLSL